MNEITCKCGCGRNRVALFYVNQNTGLWEEFKSCEQYAEYVQYCCPDENHVVYIPKLIADKLATLEAENARLAGERNEAVNAVQRLSEGQSFDAVVIADSIKRATAQHEQTIAQQAEQLAAAHDLINYITNYIHDRTDWLGKDSLLIDIAGQ